MGGILKTSANHPQKTLRAFAAWHLSGEKKLMGYRKIFKMPPIY